MNLLHIGIGILVYIIIKFSFVMFFVVNYICMYKC